VNHLFIVSRRLPDLHRYLSREFATEADVEVILDRRHGERRSGSARPEMPRGDRRRTERRNHDDLGGELNTLGYAFVRLG
jgi:hypothetical protein